MTPGQRTVSSFNLFSIQYIFAELIWIELQKTVKKDLIIKKKKKKHLQS